MHHLMGGKKNHNEKMRLTGGMQINRRYEVSDEQLLNNFKSDIHIKRNGNPINKGDYYSDFVSNENTHHHITQPQRMQPTTEHVEQVDPSSFFGSSMQGVLNQIKK